MKHETEARNNKFKRGRNAIRFHITKLHRFSCISVCFICCFPKSISCPCFNPPQTLLGFVTAPLTRASEDNLLKHLLLVNLVRFADIKESRMSKKSGLRDFFSSRQAQVLRISCETINFISVKSMRSQQCNLFSFSKRSFTKRQFILKQPAPAFQHI